MRIARDIGPQIWLTWSQIGPNFEFESRSSWHDGTEGGHSSPLGVLLECQFGKTLVNTDVLKHGNWSPGIWAHAQKKVNLTFWALPSTTGSSSPSRL